MTSAALFHAFWLLQPNAAFSVFFIEIVNFIPIYAVQFLSCQSPEMCFGPRCFAGGSAGGDQQPARPAQGS